MRRRSRMRGSVEPPTQRLTVLTDTPSIRAAASWVRPSRRSAVDIQSANVSGWPGVPGTAPANWPGALVPLPVTDMSADSPPGPAAGAAVLLTVRSAPARSPACDPFGAVLGGGIWLSE